MGGGGLVATSFMYAVMEKNRDYSESEQERGRGGGGISLSIFL